MNNSTSSSGNGIIGGQLYIIDNNYNASSVSSSIIPSVVDIDPNTPTNTLTLSNAAIATSSSINSFFNDPEDGEEDGSSSVLLNDMNISLYTCSSSSSINTGNDDEAIEISNEPTTTYYGIDNNYNKNNDSDSGSLLLLYEYKFVNLLPGEYYISVQLPSSNDSDNDYKYEFSPVWSDDGGESDDDAIELKEEQRELGTGGIVNNNNNLVDDIITTTAKLTSTINPKTGRTNCFELKEDEQNMNWNIGLVENDTRNNNSNNNNDAKDAIYYNGFENGNFPFSSSTSTSTTSATSYFIRS